VDTRITVVVVEIDEPCLSVKRRDLRCPRCTWDRRPTLLVEGRQVVLELEKAPSALAAAPPSPDEPASALKVEFGRVRIDLGTTAPRSPGPV